MATIKEIGDLFDTKIEELKKELTESFAGALGQVSTRITNLEKKLIEKDEELARLRKDFELNRRKNNIILFRIKETERDELELKHIVVDLIKKYADPLCEMYDLSNVYRLGKKRQEAIRPILVSFISNSKWYSVITKKNAFASANIGCTHDYPKDIVDKRRKLQPLIDKYIKSGQKAVLRADDIYLNGRKLEAAVIDAELLNLGSSAKRQRSPNNHITRSSSLPRTENSNTGAVPTQNAVGQSASPPFEGFSPPQNQNIG